MMVDTAIVGAGLAGLALAHRLTAAGQTVVVLDRRDRVGGRTLSQQTASGARYDLGPAWIWPHNRRMLGLVQQLGLSIQPQFATGRLVFQDDKGAVRRDLEFAPMAGSLRVAGGIAQVPEALATGPVATCLRLGHRVDRIESGHDGLSITGQGPDAPFEIQAARVVLALPPRLAAARFGFEPALSSDLVAQMAAVPTWMAGHAKVIATYDTPFWRASGLSGDAISHLGPLAEIHDASPDGHDHGALFGFVHPAATRDPDLKARARDQLDGLFGPDAPPPTELLVKRWVEDAATATDADTATLSAHPTYQPIHIHDSRWSGRLFLSGSETAAGEGGFLEGALESAERTAAEVLDR